jgi:hypothetical protein
MPSDTSTRIKELESLVTELVYIAQEYAAENPLWSGGVDRHGVHAALKRARKVMEYDKERVR